jgi:hypothetical protein
MSDSKTPRILQQQPQRDSDPEQQQSGSNEFQPKPGQKGPQQMGEGSYEGARDYKERTEEYLKRNDVEADAEAAKPRSEQEARDMERAEEEGRKHSKGEH